MNGPRKLHNATLLPDGKVLVTGGSRSAQNPNQESTDPAYEAEMWDPATGTWQTMAGFTIYRGYHSIALLLPDGRVLSAGGNAEKDSRNIFAAVSVPRRTSNYLLGADRSFLRTIIFRRHVGRDKYYKGDDDCALLGNTQLQHEPAYHSPLFLAR